MALKKKLRDPDLLDSFSPERITRIVPTGKKKVDVFEKYRPNLDEVEDYNISETRLKCRYKGTELNIRTTQGDYVPKSESDIKALRLQRKIIYSHGGPPCWEFVREKWMKKQEKKQITYKEDFQKLAHSAKAMHSKVAQSRHRTAQEFAGPIWYQELSPKQIQAVDQLEACIAWDLAHYSIERSKENIATLGLVLRPNPLKIKLALRFCCGYPVEFLLILYHLLNPGRKSFSLNDRLLLSAVVHLTIGSTLKELHVRIPSPPRYRNLDVPKTVRKKKIKYKSPYLEPSTYKPENRRFTGDYYDKHLQYPESPYFSYIIDLYEQKYFGENVSDIDLDLVTDEKEKQLIEETVFAQKMFNKLHNCEGLKLIKPRTERRCQIYEEYQERLRKQRAMGKRLILPPLATIDPPKEYPCDCQSPIEDEQNTCCDDTFRCDCDDCQCRVKTRQYVSTLCERCSRKNQEITALSVVGGVVVIKCYLTIPVIAGTYLEPVCNCMEQYRNRLKALEKQNEIKCQRVKYVMGGVVNSKIGPVYCLTMTVLNSRLKKLINMAKVSREESVNSTATETKETEIKDTCSCKKSKKTQMETIYEDDPVRENEHVSKKDQKTICTCCTCKESSSESSSTSSDFHCDCKQELQIFLDNKCTCETCKPKGETTFIINDTTEQPEEGPINVISGVYERNCDCLIKYKEKIKKLEEYKARIQARFELKSKSQKYLIGGVCNTPAGPAYSIMGLRQPVKCVCAEVMEKMQKEEEEVRRRPVSPTGRTKYGIAGVARGEEQNVFIMSHAMLTDECSCEKLYKELEEVHGGCLQSYEEYLNEIATEKEFYAEDMNVKFDDCTDELKSCYCESSTSTSTKNEDPLSSTSPNSSNKSQEFQHQKQISTTLKSEKSSDDKTPCCECMSEDESESEEILTFDPSYQIKFDPNEYSEHLENEGEDDIDIDYESLDDKELKRFYLLKHFPKSNKKWTCILRKALQVLAEDDFPLAKLPDCHKLPHFKLWIALRTGKTWTRKERDTYKLMSTKLWNHTILCYEKPKITGLNTMQQKFKNLTWTTANYWRDYVENKKFNFKRNVKHCLIDNAREFFPGTFSYEFFSPGYRDCFFSYTGGKEEDLFPYTL